MPSGNSHDIGRIPSAYAKDVPDMGRILPSMARALEVNAAVSGTRAVESFSMNARLGLASTKLLMGTSIGSTRMLNIEAAGAITLPRAGLPICSG